jgi:hypothetical protein
MANTTLWGILNGIAKDARAGTYTGGAADQNTMAWAEATAQRAAFILGTTYDNSTSYTTTYYIDAPGTTYPAGYVTPSYDTQANLGLTNIKQVGG